MTETEDQDGPVDTRAFAESWIVAHGERYRGSVTDEQVNIGDEIAELIRNSPDECWEFIKSIAEMTNNQWVLSCLGAGPLENFLNEHGLAFVDRVEELARKDPNFRFALNAVWPRGIDKSVWDRIARFRKSVESS